MPTRPSIVFDRFLTEVSHSRGVETAFAFDAGRSLFLFIDVASSSVVIELLEGRDGGRPIDSFDAFSIDTLDMVSSMVLVDFDEDWLTGNMSWMRMIVIVEISTADTFTQELSRVSESLARHLASGTSGPGGFAVEADDLLLRLFHFHLSQVSIGFLLFIKLDSMLLD